MASARIARFTTEVAPPQFVTVIRHRANKMLDTIQEEEIHANNTATATTSVNSPASLATLSHRSPSVVASSGGMDCPRRNGGFMKGVHKSISILGH